VRRRMEREGVKERGGALKERGGEVISGTEWK
jgi:hypothetical protein